MRFWLVAAGIGLAVSGCYSSPQVGPQKDTVIEAAALVVKERYPRSVVVARSDSIVALGPTEMFGATKSRKQVSVWVKETYVGWEPSIEVRLTAQLDEPRVGAYDPESASPNTARPLAAPAEWHALQRLPNEEQVLYDEILARLDG